MRLFAFIAFVVALAVSSCQKLETESVDADQFKVNRDVPVRDIAVLTADEWIACGGIRGEQGYFFRTLNGGQSWTSFDPDLGFSVNTLHFVNAQEGYAGGEFLRLWETADGGVTWQLNWLTGEEQPFHEVSRGDVQEIQFLNDSVGFFVAGDTYEVGNIFRTQNGGDWWTFDTINHELRGLDFFDTQHAMITGYGYLATSKDGGLTFEQLDASGEFWVAVHQTGIGSGIAVGQDGGIYQIENGDVTAVVKPNRTFQKRRTFNDLAFDGTVGIAVGEDGLVMRSDDSGASWRILDLGTTTAFYRVRCFLGRAFLTARGHVYSFPL